MDPQEEKKLFEEFYRGAGQHKTGLGIGLSIAGRIVHRLGGTVGIDAREGGGSIFWFTLPTAAADTLETPQA